MPDPNKSIKPLFVSTLDRGGAAQAALNIHSELLNQAVESQFLVGNKTTHGAKTIDIRQDMLPIEAWWLKKLMKKDLYINNQAQKTGAIFWSMNRRWNTVPMRINAIDADIINLHWIGQGFIPIQLMGLLNKPLVWTMHDSWAYTGGCHVPLDCTGFMRSCGSCPQLASDIPHDMSYQILKLKQENWKKLDITVVTPSNWLGERFKQSPIFADKRLEVIPNGIDLSEFTALDKHLARKQLSLDPTARYILFSAMNPQDNNKGFDLLYEALSKLSHSKMTVRLLTFGIFDDSLSLPESFPWDNLGYLDDRSILNQAFAAADVCVLPSRQENLPNTIMESIASGTPVVAFRAGGNADMIQHQEHGYLAVPYESADLARGIEWALEHSQDAGIKARHYAESHYNISNISKRYIALFEELTASKLR